GQQRGVLGELNYCRIANQSRLIVALHVFVGCDMERGQWIVGPQPSCPPKVWQGFLYLALGHQSSGKAIFGGEVCFGDLQSVGPERDIVAPKIHLPMERSSQYQKDGGNAARHCRCGNMPTLY